MAKISYRMWDGSRRELEVAEDFAIAYKVMEKEEINLERKETRRHISLDMIFEREQEYGTFGCFGSCSEDVLQRFAISDSDPLEILLQKEEDENDSQLQELAGLGLTEYQFKIAYSFYIDKKSQSQIARELGISHQAVNKTIAKINRKMKSLCKKTLKK